VSGGERDAGALREAVGLWAVAFVLVLTLALVAGQVGFVASNLYALVAAVFVGIPLWWSERRGIDWADWGVHTERRGRGVAVGLGAALVTLLVFMPGYHLWQVHVRGQQHTGGLEYVHRWDATLEGAPRGWGQEAGAWVYVQREGLHIGLRATAQQGARVILRGDSPFEPTLAADGMLIRPLDAQGMPARGPASGPARTWELLATAQHRAGEAVVAPLGDHNKPRVIQVEVKAVGQGAPVPLHVGPGGRVEADGVLRVERGLWWLVLWGLTQLFLIAWPEEVFYRGLVQTRLMQGLGEDGRGLPWRAILATSVLFGLGHLLVPVQGALWIGRASVFFPSLLFGFLRWRTGSVVAPAVYHACCNMMVLALATQYR
jgi:membrane protease YdiL (CAAX protease family)